MVFAGHVLQWTIFVRDKNVIARGNRRIMWIFVPVLLGLSHFLSACLPFRLPFGMDIGFLGAAFSLLGFLAGSWLKWATNEKHAVWDGAILLIGAVVVVICNVVAEPVCLVYQNEYAHFGSMIAAALGYTASLFILCKWTAPALRKLPAVHKLVTWYSVHSLATFPVHLTIKIAALVVFKLLGFSHWLLLFGGMLLLNVPVVNFITHYLPFMLGSFKKRPVHEAVSK